MAQFAPAMVTLQTLGASAFIDQIRPSTLVRSRGSERGQILRILLNSDVMFGDFTKGLPAQLRELAEACLVTGNSLAIPLTSLLEAQRHQNDIVRGKRNVLRTAERRLRDSGIRTDDFDENLVSPDIDVKGLFLDELPTLEILEPTMADFEEAHRRATLHLSPMVPETKSDEMRDLIIWVSAIRVSREDEGSVLVSNDSVHTGPLGEMEAEEAKLRRYSALTNAIESLEVATPGSRRMWALVKESLSSEAVPDIPFGRKPVLKRARSVIFTQGESGVSEVSALVEITGENAARIIAMLTAKVGKTITLENLTVDGTTHVDAVGAMAIKQNTAPGSSAVEKMAALRAAIRG